MQYSFNSFAYGSGASWLPSYPLDEVIRRLARIGYDGVEIGCAAPHAYPAFLSKERRKEIRNLLRSEGLKVSSMLPLPGGGPGCNPASPMEEERTFTVGHYKEVATLAAELEAPTLLYIAGWQVFGSSREECWKRSLDCLRAIAADAASKGLTVAVEPTSTDSNLIDLADQALELARASGLDNVKVMFDTTHTMFRGENPADYARIMGPDLAHFHAANRDRAAPGDGGGVEWLEVMQALKDVGYKGYITMEIGFNSRHIDPDALARRSLSYLRSVEAQLR